VTVTVLPSVVIPSSAGHWVEGWMPLASSPRACHSRFRATLAASTAVPSE
jgi:hypothetical protein